MRGVFLCSKPGAFWCLRICAVFQPSGVWATQQRAAEKTVPLAVLSEEAAGGWLKQKFSSSE